MFTITKTDNGFRIDTDNEGLHALADMIGLPMPKGEQRTSYPRFDDEGLIHKELESATGRFVG